MNCKSVYIFNDASFGFVGSDYETMLANPTDEDDI
jgi:hypothetical protein